MQLPRIRKKPVIAGVVIVAIVVTVWFYLASHSVTSKPAPKIVPKSNLHKGVALDTDAKHRGKAHAPARLDDEGGDEGDEDPEPEPEPEPVHSRRTKHRVIKDSYADEEDPYVRRPRHRVRRPRYDDDEEAPVPARGRARGRKQRYDQVNDAKYKKSSRQFEEEQDQAVDEEQEEQEQQQEQQQEQEQEQEQGNIQDAGSKGFGEGKKDKGGEEAGLFRTSMDSANSRIGCLHATKAVKDADVKVKEMFASNPFSNPGNAGGWKQGWEITYDKQQWDDEPLKIWLMPHSHNDPGWLKTVDEYFRAQTRNILSEMTASLSRDSWKTFGWAEMSYLSMWWKEATQQEKTAFKKLVNDGQIEILAGGWVMPDEANSHYYALLDQLIEGHQWLSSNLPGILPSNGWSIDPFGYSPTMAYILKRSGFDAMIIQRVHYEFKHVLARSKQLEFNWRQSWDRGTDTDIFCHLFPFYSYDIPHTCGPDPAICCQFDFARLPGSRYSCPWGISPTTITPANVNQKASMLIEQYRKKSQLYNTKNVFIPLGDDFRWDQANEIQNQFTNYKMLFDHINDTPSFKAQAKFGTLKDYFASVAKETKQYPDRIPSLSGDFFTYADRDDHYWSGYFTSRPFWKFMDRVLEQTLRKAEILYSLHRFMELKEAPDYNVLVSSRRALALFQHHDGVTGTAKDPVVSDYGRRMYEAIKSLQEFSSSIVGEMVNNGGGDNNADINHVSFDHESTLPDKDAIEMRHHVPFNRAIVLFNSLTQTRRQMTSVIVQSIDVQVVDSFGKVVPSQLCPVWQTNNLPSPSEFELWFEVELAALSLTTFYIRKMSPSTSTLSTVEIRGQTQQDAQSPFKSRENQSGSAFTAENSVYSLTFDGQSGLLNSIAIKNSDIVLNCKARFFSYGSKFEGDRISGAYLFFPPGPAMSYESNSAPITRIVRGPLVTEVSVVMQHVTHVVKIFNTNGASSSSIDITNFVNIETMRDREFVMRFETGIQSGKKFYSDLNGFQMNERETYDKLPLQANYYPMPAMAFIEDSRARLSVHTHSALGVASLEQGWLEVKLDRKLSHDDNRGLGQGVQDSRLTKFKFALTLERSVGSRPSPTVNNPTLLGHMVNDYLNHPISIFISHDPVDKISNLITMKNDLPCDVHMVNLRGLPEGSSALVLHRRGHVCGFVSPSMPCSRQQGKINLQTIFKNLNLVAANENSLSMLHEKKQAMNPELTLDPMEMYTYKVLYSRN